MRTRYQTRTQKLLYRAGGALLAAALLIGPGYAAAASAGAETAAEDGTNAAVGANAGLRQTSGEMNTIYGIGSISKVFPAVAILQLCEQGKLELDAPLTNYIPEFTMADPRYRDITPRMLLDHSAGLMGTSDRGAMLLGERSSYGHDTILEQLRVQRLKAAPGAYSVYSNDGFTLAEILVERVSGQSFTDYMQEKICAPLGMVSTATPQSSFNRERQAKIYYPDSNMELPPEYLNEIGAGGILSTAEDLCRFGQLFMRKGTAVLSQESVGEMEKPGVNNPLFSQEGEGLYKYGLGWDNVDTYPFKTYGIKAVNKGGDTAVYHGNLTVLPEENMSAAVLTSGGSSTVDQLMVQEILLSALRQKGKAGGRTPQNMPELLETAGFPEQLEEYEGYYIAEGMLKVRFSREGKLYISTLDNRRNVTQEYLPAVGEQFVSTGGNYISSGGSLLSAEGGARGRTVLSFQTGTNGERYLCMTTYETQPGLGTRAVTMPFAQKAEENPLGSTEKEQWTARDGKKYYLVSEGASSSAWLTPSTTLRLPVEGEGYVRNAKITDAQTARSFVQIPTMLGRDLLDYRFTIQGGAEYMEMLSGSDETDALKRRYIREDGMETLSQGARYVLGEGETARWYTVPDGLAGKKAAISAPSGAAYFIYDSMDTMTCSSIVADAPKSARLPKGGKLLLTGRPGEAFDVEF